MMRAVNLYCFLWISCGWAGAWAQPMGASANGMGGCTLGSSDPAVIRERPSGLADAAPALAIYLNQPFLMLSRNQAVSVFELAGGKMGFDFFSEGRTFYRQSGLGIGFGKKLSKSLYAGVYLGYSRLRLNGEYYQSALHYGLGAAYAFSKQLQLGAHINDPMLQASYLNFGFYYRPYPSLGCVLEMDLGAQNAIRLGFEYNLHEKFYLRCGLSSRPMKWAFGFGWKKKKLKADFALVQHLLLGTSPHLSFSHAF